MGGRRLLTALAVLALIPGCSSTDTQVQRLQARSVYEQAIKNLQEDRLSLGLAALQQAIALDPENATYRNSLGVLYLNLRQSTPSEFRYVAFSGSSAMACWRAASPRETRSSWRFLMACS